MQERPYKAFMKYWTAKPAANKTPSTAATKIVPQINARPQIIQGLSESPGV
jgi:hypothetical protein